MSSRFLALNYSETIAPLPPKSVLFAGTQWAKITQRLILEALDTVTIENLMVCLSYEVYLASPLKIQLTFV
jgi:hypothetical protein